MRLTEVLRSKGDGVVTVPPETDVTTLLSVLAEHGIGAAVVSGDGRRVEGIVSERDVVRAVAARGPDVLQDAVSTICTTEVHTCRRDDQVDDVMRVMTERRIRHVPVVEKDALVGIVSIGDIVKRRLSELEDERRALSQYISG